MEETLTECLTRLREDLNKLKKGREYLDTNLEENSTSARRLLEPITITSIFAVCPSQSTPEADDIEKLLDNFHYLVSSNEDPEVWTNFGHELGMICVKVLSAMERTDRFQEMFSKLLTVTKEITKNNSNVLKAIARQVLNVFINVKFSPGYLETILQKYIIILRNAEELVLYNFSLQNLALLKTFSMLVQGVGDFETQFSVMEVVFLHLSNNKRFMVDFFGVAEKDKALFQSLTFDSFEEDCRLFLNSLNKPGEGIERRVYSISCHILYLGGGFVEPQRGRRVIWVDANKETERVSFKCSHFDSEDQSVFYVMFPDIKLVQIKNEKSEGNCCVTIKTNKLRHLDCNIENEDICLIAENKKDVSEFVSFLELMIKKKKQKFSKSTPLFIDRSLIRGEGLQVNAISSSARLEMDTILPDVINLFGKPEEEKNQIQIKTPPPSSEETKIIPETQNSLSFLASLPAIVPESREDFRSSEGRFFLEGGFFGAEKENKPPNKQKTYSRKPKPLGKDPPRQRVLRERKQPEAALEDCFRQNVQHKKPSLPKFKRKKTQLEGDNNKKQQRRSRHKESSNIQREIKQPDSPKPSLLVQNGYGYQRWKRPTTSERGKFWLRKIPKEESEPKINVFEFPDTDFETIKKPKRKVVHSKRRYRKQKYDTKHPSLKQVTKFYRNVKKPSPQTEKPSPVPLPEPAEFYREPVSFRVEQQSSPGCNASVESNTLGGSITRSESSSEDERLEIQKRDRSEEENSLTRIHLKKKFKTKLHIPEALSPAIRRRGHPTIIQKAEDKAQQQTNEIIATMNKATNQLLNHFQRKDGVKMMSYMKVVEEVSTILEENVSELNLRVKRLHKAILYFKTRCSISKIHQSVETHFEKIKDGIKEAETKTGEEKKVHKVTERLKSAIKEGIERSVKKEMASKRHQLLRCASILDIEFG